MRKRTYQREEAVGDDEYVEAECPQCEAPIPIRFQRGRHTRRLRCPVCQNLVTLARPERQDEPDLIQIQPKGRQP